MPLTVTAKKIKHSGITLTKHIQDLYTKNYNVLMKNMKEDLNEEETSYIHGKGDSTQ